jgi:LysM repeat protein
MGSYIKLYTILPGDTCWDIAVKNNMTMTELLILNPELNFYNLLIGMQIYIKDDFMINEISKKMEKINIRQK